MSTKVKVIWPEDGKIVMEPGKGVFTGELEHAEIPSSCHMIPWTEPGTSHQASELTFVAGPTPSAAILAAHYICRGLNVVFEYMDLDEKLKKSLIKRSQMFASQGFLVVKRNQMPDDINELYDCLDRPYFEHTHQSYFYVGPITSVNFNNLVLHGTRYSWKRSPIGLVDIPDTDITVLVPYRFMRYYIGRSGDTFCLHQMEPDPSRLSCGHSDFQRVNGITVSTRSDWVISYEENRVGMYSDGKALDCVSYVGPEFSANQVAGISDDDSQAEQSDPEMLF